MEAGHFPIVAYILTCLFDEEGILCDGALRLIGKKDGGIRIAKLRAHQNKQQNIVNDTVHLSFLLTSHTCARQCKERCI